MPRLLMLPPAPASRVGPHEVRLDGKFVEGMRHICANWPGEVGCVLRGSDAAIPFGDNYDPAQLPFDLTLLAEGQAVPQEILDASDIVEASGDLHLDLDLADRTAGQRTRCVFVIEYTLGTRLQILGLDRDRSTVQKAKSALWLLGQERRRRRALRRADGVQVNGFPAYDAYRALNGNTVMYLDNRMQGTMFADQGELARKAAVLTAGGPLRLINSGRLEPLKGAQDLVPVARALNDRGVNFTLDIYGTGSLQDQIRADIQTYQLADRVRLHAPVDFVTELVPISRRDADLFLSCHRQSDPSCTYLEAIGCGLPVVGYDNAMLSRLASDSTAGWTVPLADTAALADLIAARATDPAGIGAASRAALDFARKHDFATEFALRRDHLLHLLDASETPADLTKKRV
ncbi:glycosyltransferase [uncultured Paracoccus sp.]|uniref:glycosyltransferase n=1 Tax=uncultured Paracoccus sp. TaxID=189685 RepID=UPI00261C133B|nr:glycosyltransferase [uncultured Paracoccus sp.]